MEMFTTMITPYKADGTIDYGTVEKYVDWYFENGLDGIFAICQSSEIFHLSLEERVNLNSFIYARAKKLEKLYSRKFTVVSSGHVGNSIDEQIEELNAIWRSGTDTLILITNRLDMNNEGDDVWINNCRTLIDSLPDDVKLGLYECPYPYKRLATPKIFDFCISTGKFYYMKDTCCDAALIKQRCEQLKGSTLKLLNANCQTLLETMQNGADGYCGIMCNYHPRLYAWLCENYSENAEDAALVQATIGSLGFTEVGLPYPLTAKYHMNLCGIPTENIARNRKSKELTDYARSCMKQMKLVTDTLENYLMGKGK